jgi:hypothetical protein
VTAGIRFAASARQKLVLRILMAIGGGAAIAGILLAPERAWPAVLINGFYCLSLSLMGALFITTQRLAGARWSASLRRIPEALMAALPATACIMLTLFLGRHWIYPWSRPGAFAGVPAIAGKIRYLQPSAVFARTLIALALWTVLFWLFRRTSLAQDGDARLLHHFRLNRLAAIFAVVFPVTFTLGAFDWLLSVDPHWFSTMFAVYVFAGCFVQGLAAITLIVVSLRSTELLKAFISKDQLHDLGRLLFAFSTLWAYIWFCQYLLIWYSNLPDEISPYVKTTAGRWLPLFAANVVVNWVVPFAVLLPARAKRSEAVLKAVCVILLCGHWLDLYLLVMPSFREAPALGILDVLIAAGCLGLFCSFVIRALARAPLVPVNDPFLIDSLRLEHS